MPAPEQASAQTYAGKFRHAVDSKNRVTIPALWRVGEEEQFYASLGQNSEYINLYPPSVFQEKGENLKNDPRVSARDKRIYLRVFYSSAHLVSTDKQGRILLPQELSDAAGIEGDVYLLGTEERIEVWPVERLEASMPDQLTTYAQVANIIGD